MHVCVCVCVCVCNEITSGISFATSDTCAGVCVMYICMCVCVMCVCGCMYIYICVCVCVPGNKTLGEEYCDLLQMTSDFRLPGVYTHAHTGTHMHIHTYIHIHSHTHTHTYMHNRCYQARVISVIACVCSVSG